MRTIFIALILNLYIIAPILAQAGANYLFPITDAGKQEILSAHAAARNVLAASDMATLKWSDTLAKIWPNNNPNYCTFNHFADRSKYYTKYVGENLFAASGNNSFTYMVNSWISEKADYAYGSYPQFCGSGKVCGHYTQIIWGQTDEVGCAYFDCRNGRGSWAYLFVCNYAIGGNFVGRYPYTPGTSSCVDTTTTCASVACGSITNSCGTRLNCSNTCSNTQRCVTNTCNACSSQCGTRTCGTVWNSCYNGGNGGDEKCGSNNGGCSGSNICQNNQCVAPTTCTPTRDSSICNGTVCGVYDNGCNSSISCTCGSGFQCSLGKCQAIPCGGNCLASKFETCVNNACACQSGYLRNVVTQTCDVIPPSSPTTNTGGLSQWVSVIPTDIGNNWVVLPDNSVLDMVGPASTSSVYRLRWKSSSALATEEKTIFRSDVKLSGNGVFGLAIREQSTGAQYSNWIFTIVGNSVQISWAISSTSKTDRTKTTNGPYAGWKVNDWNTVEIAMEDLPNYDSYYGSDYTWFSVKINGAVATQYQYNGYAVSALPQKGSAFIETKQLASFRNTYILTKTSLLVTFAGCLTQSQLNALCTSFAATSCSMESSCSQRRQATGGASSVALITFSSTEGISSETLATQFTQAAYAQDSRMVQYPTVTNIESGQSVSGANLPVDPTQANIYDGTSGGTNGLSSGAIVGISIGSAAAAFGVGVIAVAAIVGGIVAAIKVRGKTKAKLQTSASPQKEQQESKTHGPDLFDTDPTSKHSSITYRAPAVEVNV